MAGESEYDEIQQCPADSKEPRHKLTLTISDVDSYAITAAARQACYYYIIHVIMLYKHCEARQCYYVYNNTVQQHKFRQFLPNN